MAGIFQFLISFAEALGEIVYAFERHSSKRIPMAVFRTRKQSTLQPIAVNPRPPQLNLNPSEWRSRLRVLVLAPAGFCIATYLALDQWGVLKTVWEPFFEDDSERVLHSFVSRLGPVPNAVLGALGYLADLATGLIRARSRTMPKMVLIYGFIVCLVGATALVLGASPVERGIEMKDLAERPFVSATSIVCIDALALGRFGLRAADDPLMINGVRVIDLRLKMERWRFSDKIQSLNKGKNLSIEVRAPLACAAAPMVGNTSRDLERKDSKLGIHFVDSPGTLFATDTASVSTFRWTNQETGKGTISPFRCDAGRWWEQIP